jgi:hypothetical protein
LPSRRRCWYGMPKLRALCAEYKDISDDDLSKRLYAAAGTPVNEQPSPFQKALPLLGIGIGVPAAALILGCSIVWAFSGFMSTQPSSPW